MQRVGDDEMEWEWNVSRVPSAHARLLSPLGLRGDARHEHFLYVASRALRISKEPTTHPQLTKNLFRGTEQHSLLTVPGTGTVVVGGVRASHGHGGDLEQ